MLLDNCTPIVVLHLLDVPSRKRQRPCTIPVVNKSEMTLMKCHWMQKFCRITSWLLAVAIIVLSLVPPSYRPTTDASQSVEHFAIFLGIGFAAGFGYPGRPFVLAASLMVFCGAIEFVQLWVPGRHARLNDFIVDIAAALIGLSVTFVVMRLARQVTGPTAGMPATRHPNT
jgi:VanZ family protein